jgi:hypothetical protein
MAHTTQKWLTLAAVLGLAYWFFGNLYEEVVFSPNWVADSPAQLQRLHEFFVHTSPAWYFMPLTAIATVLVWILWALNRSSTVRAEYRRAGLFALLATAVNLLIVGTVITKLFAADYLAHAAELNAYCWRWNVLNVLRMLLVATTATYLFNAFRKLDRAATQTGV